MVSYMEREHVELFLMHILSPLYRVAEDDTIRDPHMSMWMSHLYKQTF